MEGEGVVYTAVTSLRPDLEREWINLLPRPRHFPNARNISHSPPVMTHSSNLDVATFNRNGSVSDVEDEDDWDNSTGVRHVKDAVHDLSKTLLTYLQDLH